MILALRILNAILGLAAVAICLSIVVYGPANTANFSETLFDTLTGSSYPLTGPWPATMDSELRFYAPFWGAYGLVLISVARNLPGRLHYVPPLAMIFFIGGVGRALSYVLVGPPHPFFSFLMVIELLLPVAFLTLWRGVRSRMI